MKERDKKKLITIIGLLFSLLFLKCKSSNYYEKTIDINNHWKKQIPAVFSFKIKDKQPKTLNLLLRNNNDYEFSNIYFFIHQTNPNGEKEIDTVQYYLAKPTGEWIGSGTTQIKQNFLELKSSQTFKKGSYKIQIYQGMRRNNLKGIEDITLVIN